MLNLGYQTDKAVAFLFNVAALTALFCAPAVVIVVWKWAL